jgi:hypothetical protein
MGYRDLGILAEEYARLGYDRDVAAELAHRSPGPLRAMARAREEAVAQAQAALGAYASHKSGCNVARALPFERRRGGISCTCGYEAAIRSLSNPGGDDEG